MADHQRSGKSVFPLEVRLSEIETRLTLKLDNLIEKFDSVSNGTGFPRCSDRGARIATLEREMSEIRAAAAKKAKEEATRLHDDVSRREFEKLERSFIWLRNIIVTGLLVAIVLKLWISGGTL